MYDDCLSLLNCIVIANIIKLSVNSSGKHLKYVFHSISEKVNSIEVESYLGGGRRGVEVIQEILFLFAHTGVIRNIHAELHQNQYTRLGEFSDKHTNSD